MTAGCPRLTSAAAMIAIAAGAGCGEKSKPADIAVRWDAAIQRDDHVYIGFVSNNRIRAERARLEVVGSTASVTLFTSAAAQAAEEAVRRTYCHVIDLPHGVTDVVDGQEAANQTGTVDQQSQRVLARLRGLIRIGHCSRLPVETG